MSDSISIWVGNRIRQRRMALGMSQAMLAQELSISTQAISLWENGKTSPSGSNLSALAAVLRCDMRWLLEGDLEDQFTNKIDNYQNPTEFTTNLRDMEKTHPHDRGKGLKDDDELNRLIHIFNSVDRSYQLKIMRHAIGVWKESMEEEINKLDALYKEQD